MPLELIEDISRGRSWLSFARGSKAREQAASSLGYEYDAASEAEYVETPSQSGSTGRVSAKRPGKTYPGKTYDSVESIAEFFNKRAARMGGAGRPNQVPRTASPAGVEAKRQESGSPDQHSPLNSEDFVPGSYVRHAKYGRGLVLRREGTGPATKLTVSFPGYGQKKLVEKYAGLQKDA
jgi:DNA helicase-2/ATP-dependent DNA helicase PcrA